MPPTSDREDIPPVTNTELLDWLDEQAAAFSSATTREHYLNSSGQKDDLSLAPIYERHADLFRRDTVDRVLAVSAGDERLPHLRQFVVDGYLEQAVNVLVEELAARETADTVAWDGDTLPYRAVQQRVMNEADAARRHDLDARRAEATAAQNPLRERRWDAMYGQAHNLGFESYAALCDNVGALDLDNLRAQMERFLADTEAPYHERLARELAAIGIAPNEAERSDLLRMFRSPELDSSFPRERMLPALQASLQGLGIARAQSNVHLDTEERPRKSPRAFCAPVQIPDEIYLVISPHGGHDDYRALFHEAGHAQHFAHILPELPFAFRGLGDNSVTEGFAFVLEHLLYSDAWLRRYLNFDDNAAYLSLVRFHRLYMLRRYAAKLLYELELHHGNDVRPNAERYATVLSEHVGARYSAADYLSDVDGGFYCARYLRAWIFDAQVRGWFARRWGNEWFVAPEAGVALRELWSQGQRHAAEEILRQLGESGLDMRPLAKELSTA
ncbi:MAG: hypothetical protein WBD55_02260 [Dehalococcoidia bacterium]